MNRENAKRKRIPSEDEEATPKRKKPCGPGSLETRIERLKVKVKSAGVQRARELIQTENPRVLQLAWYMYSNEKMSKTKERLIEKYKKGLEKLLGDQKK